jgi:AcrR family transcriptional regulator
MSKTIDRYHAAGREHGAADTKSRLLDVAEQLFAEQGISATSLRSITAEAGANQASIHYHFGSKEELIREVFARRFDPINRERLRLLSEIEADSAAARPRLDKLIEAVVGPVLRLESPDESRRWTLFRLMGKVHSESEEIQELVFGQFREIAERAMPLLQASLPELGLNVLLWRARFLIGVMTMGLHPLPGVEPLEAIQAEARDPELVLAQMIPFLEAGFRAPVKPPAADQEVS